MQIDPDARKGAVLVLLYPRDGEIYTVLMLRNVYSGTHSGQVSFPGGKWEKTDADLWRTASREAQEEVGVQPESIRLLGQLSQVYIPPSRFLVSPYVAVAENTPTFRPDPVEVARIIETPLSHILKAETVGDTEVFVQALRKQMAVKYFAIDNETVWGATAMMLSELAEVIYLHNVQVSLTEN